MNVSENSEKYIFAENRLRKRILGIFAFIGSASIPNSLSPLYRTRNVELVQSREEVSRQQMVRGLGNAHDKILR